MDYVADRVHELATHGPDGTFHLVAGRNATTVGRLLEMSSEELGCAQPTVLSPRLYRSWVHPWLRRKHRGLRRMEVYFPYFAMRVRFDDRRLGPGPRVEGYFHRLVRYAQAAGWGRSVGPTLVCVIEKLVEQIEGRFAELSEQMADPEVISDQRRYAEAGRAYRTLERAHGLAQEWRRATDDAAGARELIAEDGDDSELREMLRNSEERIGELEEEIRLAMVEPDPNDDRT